MRYFVATLFLVILFGSFRSGVSMATVVAKSASGHTSFSASLYDMESLESAEFIVDGSKYTFSRDNAECHVIFDPENGIFTMVLKSKDLSKPWRYLKFWAVPTTFKLTLREKGSGTQFHNQYEFKARVSGSDPRPGKDDTPEIELLCKLDHEL